MDEALSFCSVREFRDHASQMLRSSSPVMVTRHGKPAGLYIPLHATELPPQVRDALLGLIGSYVQQRLQQANLSEEEILHDFASSREPRR